MDMDILPGHEIPVRPAARGPWLPRWSRTVALLALLTGAAVGSPALPTAAQPFAPPPHFREWWRRTEACAGLKGNFDRIAWYQVPHARTFPTRLGEKVGLWTRQEHGTRIVVAEAYRDDELVVRHEMLHDLLDRGGHPAEYFEVRCGLTWQRWP